MSEFTACRKQMFALPDPRFLSWPPAEGKTSPLFCNSFSSWRFSSVHLYFFLVLSYWIGMLTHFWFGRTFMSPKFLGMYLFIWGISGASNLVPITWRVYIPFDLQTLTAGSTRCQSGPPMAKPVLPQNKTKLNSNKWVSCNLMPDGCARIGTTSVHECFPPLNSWLAADNIMLI